MLPAWITTDACTIGTDSSMPDAGATGRDSSTTGGAMPDGGTTIPVCEGVACIPADLSCAGAPTLDRSRVVDLDYAVSDVVPLCSGRVLMADGAHNRLVVLSMETGDELDVIPPHSLANVHRARCGGTNAAGHVRCDPDHRRCGSRQRKRARDRRGW